jgi:predicted phosphodiesterase
VKEEMMHLGAFVHLSDLHFGRDLFDATIPSGIKYSAATQFIFKMTPHDINILEMLEHNLAGIRSKMGLLEFDGWFVTGDILTYPYCESSFDDFAYDYLTNRIPRYHKKTGIQKDIGLEIDPEKLFCVPGNHDKMLRLDCEPYKSSKFCSNPHSACNYVRRVDGHNNQIFLIIGIDSNYYEYPAMAVGEIKDEDVNIVVQWMKDLQAGEEVRRLRLSADEYEDSIKIAILHHSLKPHLSPTYQWCKLIDRQKRLDELTLYFDIILYGHFHEHGLYYYNDAYLIACGSTSQHHHKNRKNAFNVLWFEQDITDKYLLVQEYVWDNLIFVEEPEQRITLPRHCT